MPRSRLLPTVLSSAVLAAAVLASCDPICLDGVSPPGPGREYQSVSGACVAVVVTSPDAGGSDGGTDAGDAGEDPDAGPGEQSCGKSGWTTQVLDEGLDSLSATFVFDARGVGHYAYSKDSHLYVGTTRPGDAPMQVGGVATAYDVNMAVAADGTHHVLFQQGDSFGYAHDTGGVWHSELLGKGWIGAIALDSQGAPHLFIGQPSMLMGYLYGTRSEDGTWSLTPLNALGIAGDRERLVVDAAGHLHTVFVRTLSGSFQAVYATNAAGTWTEEPLDWTIPNGSPRFRIALRVDAAGQPSLLGSDSQGASLWVKDGSGWKQQRLGGLLSRGPSLTESPSGLGVALLDDAAPDANSSGSPSQWVVKTWDGPSVVGTTPPALLETRDGGNALLGDSAVHVDAQDAVQAGLFYIHYTSPDGGGLPQMTRGLRYARYCP
ncbi:hypothetical protein [Corallococcus silvisoli]|uniref:hypothetical protein n=1 Tax=Corallococcus silvisoli TaxID=2697031 RepID=UPI001376FE83|nr:hypothetical protein [Corallococcus silvisoli]NBD12618.1 hypothetical protein [Corallococcus silvisoli]